MVTAVLPNEKYLKASDITGENFKRFWYFSEEYMKII